MTTVKLTQELINKGLTPQSGKRRSEICDTEVPGLYIEVRETSEGQGTYYLRYKNAAGTTAHQRIGRTKALSLADARKKARALKAEVQLGADPRGNERARKAAMTLDTFFGEHYLPHAKAHKRSWQRDEELYRLRISAVFGQRKLHEVSKQQVQVFHAGIVAAGLAPATADHHVKLLRQALNLAVEWDLLEKNPIAGVRLFNADNKVEHYLDETQLDRLLTVLRTDDNRVVCNIALFLLSTGCRLNEALSGTWDQIDEERRVWRIPASNSKSKRVRSVPLNDSALEVLKAIGTKGRCVEIFRNWRSGKPYTTIMKVWSRLREKAGLPYLRIHDLRHQYASFLVNSGRTLYEVQAILGHSDPSVTQRYAHLSSVSLQEAANSASIAIRGSVPVSGDAAC